MCRAVYALVVGRDDESCARLRRAAGLEVQVMGTTTAPGEVPDWPFDVIVLDGGAPGAPDAVAGYRRDAPDAAILWVGEGPPEGAHHAVADDDDLADALPGAITKALLARRR